MQFGTQVTLPFHHTITRHCACWRHDVGVACLVGNILRKYWAFGKMLAGIEFQIETEPVGGFGLPAA